MPHLYLLSGEAYCIVYDNSNKFFLITFKGKLTFYIFCMVLFISLEKMPFRGPSSFLKTNAFDDP